MSLISTLLCDVKPPKFTSKQFTKSKAAELSILQSVIVFFLQAFFSLLTEQSPEEMNKLLMLLLGCAVQCEEKEEYIERIQTLETKAAIAAHIHEVTHSQENVLDLQWLESSEVHPTDFEVAARNLATHLQRVLDQRDTHLETIAQLMQEKEGVVSLLNSPSSPQSGSYSPSMQQQTGTQQHLSVELADSKAKIRRLRQELEEKSEQMLDCRHELENMEVELKRIQQENSQLLVDARAARTYRDELDALRERAMKADKLESEVGRYREQPKMEVCKAKVEELKEDNRVLQETKEVLEDQLAGWRASSDRIHHLEKHSLLLETRVHDMEQEREAERKRTEELQDENLALSLAQRRLMEESQHLGWELDQLTKTTESHQTLSDEVSERTCSRMLKLEKENQSLSKTIEELRAASINNNTRTKHGHRLERDVFQETCSIGNLNLGEPTYCHQLFPAEDLEQVQSEILLTENPDLLAREKGQTIQRLEAEVQELEAENQIPQANFEEIRISARRLEQLETDKQSLEQETTTFEREKRHLEKENRGLRQQAEIQEANLDSSNVSMAGLEREMPFLVKEVEGTAERVKGLERDNRELTKQAAIDQRTLATLREELVIEKLKTQQRELLSMVHDFEMRVLNQESMLNFLFPLCRRFKMQESELESSLKKSLRIKDDKMAALEPRLLESSTLSLELKTVRLSYEALQQRLEEEWTASSSTPPRETGKAMGEWLRESQEATKELLKNVSGRHICMSHFGIIPSSPLLQNATLEAERQAMQAQLRQLENQSDSQQAQVLALQRQAATLQENNTALQTLNANLQVEKYTLNSQSASLMAQNAQLQQQQSGTESERDNATRELEELRAVQEQLLRDHKLLAELHEWQTMDYEALIDKHGCLKKAHFALTLEYRTMQDSYNSLLQQRTKLEDLEKVLKEEQMRMALEKEQNRTTAAECCRLRDEKDRLNLTYRQLVNDKESLTADHKELKSQLNEAKLEHTWLEADFSKLKKEFQQLNITSTKLTNQCELLSQLKGNLEEKSCLLLGQIETLMLQNRTLLEQTMESKDLFHVEERQYIDKLNDLRRQKERLEEKIMDQYKFYEPSPPRRRGNWFALKMKKLIKSNSHEHGPDRPPTPTHSGVAELHLSNSSIGADGSGASGATSAGDAVSPQRNSKANNCFRKTFLCCPLLFITNMFRLLTHFHFPGMNGVESRAQSESSGEFTVSLENEPWSNGSSPVQQPPSRCSSSSFQSPIIQSLPKQKNPVISEDFWLTKGTKSIQRGSRGKVTRRSSDSAGAVKTNPGLNGITSNSSSNKAETTRALACSPITVLYVQGKGSRLPKSLPRASGVISTAEGSSRRCSVNSDCRVTVKTDPLSIQVSDNGSKRVEAPSQPEPEANNSEPDPMPPVKPPRDPTVVPTDNPKSPGKESLLGSSFTFQSVFSNTIFSESVVTTMTGLETLENNQISPCPNPSLVQNGPLESQESSPNEPQTLLGVVDEQSQNAEHAPAQEEHDEPLTSA
uniref:Coiled-coil domain containing 88Aa n=1 Tax=Gasterosteus aculeatus aculeatus TaxID=481459 RepID=A0AAQ4RJA0_GASAC